MRGLLATMWTVTARGPTYDYRDYVHLLQFINAGREKGEDHLVIDFSRVEFAHPDGMAPMIATVRSMLDVGLRVQVVPPDGADQEDYWHKVGWIAGLKGDPAPTLDRRSTFLPLTAYANPDELNAFLSDALHVLAETEVFPPGILDAFAWSINEMADNVLLHAESEGPGWLQLTTFRHKHRIEFVVVDTGQGVLKSLRPAYPDLRTDKEAPAEGG